MSQAIEIFGFFKVRSRMIFEARNVSRRCTIVTLSANLVRKFASSMAESPPPTTMISLPRKKNPSHVAQVETPWPRRRFSDARPSMRADAPVAMMRVRVKISRCGLIVNRNGRRDRSAPTASPCRYSVPNRAACRRIFSISSGP